MVLRRYEDCLRFGSAGGRLHLPDGGGRDRCHTCHGRSGRVSFLVSGWEYDRLPPRCWKWRSDLPCRRRREPSPTIDELAAFPQTPATGGNGDVTVSGDEHSTP